MIFPRLKEMISFGLLNLTLTDYKRIARFGSSFILISEKEFGIIKNSDILSATVAIECLLLLCDIAA